MTFGQRLKILRQRRGMSQRWLARECGISDVSVCFYEKEGRPDRRELAVIPSAENLAAMAAVFGVTMDELRLGIGRCDPAILAPEMATVEGGTG